MLTERLPDPGLPETPPPGEPADLLAPVDALQRPGPAAWGPPLGGGRARSPGEGLWLAPPPLQGATGFATRNQLWLPQPELTTCTRGLLVRDTSGQALPHAQRYNHYPASALCSVSWFPAGGVRMLPVGVTPDTDRPGRDPAAAEHADGEHGVSLFSGPQPHPRISHALPGSHGLMLLLLPDALQALTGLNPADWVGRIEPADPWLGPEWQALGEAVMAAADDGQRVALIEAFLLQRWRACRPDAGQIGLSLQDWTRGLTLRAASSGLGRSLRQVERRIKHWTGLPLRELRGLSRVEQSFFDAIAAQAAGQLRWAEVAHQQGYADQAHLCRTVRRVTGCSPEELRRRIETDEGYWLYRVWC